MDDARVEHLRLIQAVVTRLAHDSFLYKGWAVVLVAGILALGSGLDTPWYMFVALVPAFAFWGLDAYYLRQERLFRKLYDAVRRQPFPEWEKDPFSMDTKACEGEVATWWRVCWSKTIAPLYGLIVLLVVVAAVLSLCAGC
jgi:hypothetical protein